jgi:hypothetical protein
MATTAPITAGGIATSIHPIPLYLTIRDMVTKKNPKKINPDCAWLKAPYVLIIRRDGAIKAKLDPR